VQYHFSFFLGMVKYTAHRQKKAIWYTGVMHGNPLSVSKIAI
jgi:hypothetical protein